MASTKKKVTARAVVRFMDLPSRKNERGASSGWGLKIDYGILKPNSQSLPPFPG